MHEPATQTVAMEPPVWALWKNPIFLRYCRARLRPKNLVVWLLLSLLASGFLFSIFRATGAARGKLDAIDVERLTILPVLIIQAVILFIFGTAQTSGGMITEADEGTLDYQRLMPMSPTSKVLGYLFGLPVREYLMFLSTLPFSIWAFWRGEVPFMVAFYIYSCLLGSTVLYHLTGLLTGTVVKNRRWAFLASIGLIFALYTIIPQLAKFGLVCFKYLGIAPVVEEHLQYLAPRKFGAAITTTQQLIAEARFFGLKFPEAVFTLFSQSGLIIALFFMLYRRWKKTESLLLGKISAFFLNAWVHLLLLGNALPIIDSGEIFPSQGFNRRFRMAMGKWEPSKSEALIMCVVYAVFSFMLVTILMNLCTSSPEMQARAWRKAKKYGHNSLPALSDAATSLWATLLMTLTGLGAWYVFATSVVESRWYPGFFIPAGNIAMVGAVLLLVCVSTQALLEAFGRAKASFVLLFTGVIPMMVSAVAFASSDKLGHLAVWIGGISPVPLLALGVVNEVPMGQIPKDFSRTVPFAFYFWLSVYLLGTLYLLKLLWKQRLERSR